MQSEDEHMSDVEESVSGGNPENFYEVSRARVVWMRMLKLHRMQILLNDTMTNQLYVFHYTYQKVAYASASIYFRRTSNPTESRQSLSFYHQEKKKF